MKPVSSKTNKRPHSQRQKAASQNSNNHVNKCPTGIKGFDQITEGGLPKNRTTLICGSAGSGKTLMGIDFLIKGASQYN
ncbi:MAG: hypothetical protein H7Y43_12460, partial [Akkermansiaceae bacterium]|nr:hypothetical protein [Verrucomicrobiales bacterium]